MNGVEDSTRIEDLEEEVAAQQQTILALVNRLDRTVTAGNGAFSLFQQNTLLQQTVHQTTRELESINTQLCGQILERRQADQALRASEQRYRALFDQSPYPMWVIDAISLKFLEVNQAAIKHYGYSGDEFLHMTAADIRPAEDVEQFRAHMSRTPGSAGRKVWRHQKKDGTVIQVDVTAHALELNGRPIKLVIANDLTDRLQAEEALQQSQSFLEAAQEIGGIGSWGIDLHSFQVTWSKGQYKLFGLNPVKVTTSYELFLSAIHPDELERVKELTDKTLSDGVPHDMDFRIVWPDGSIHWIHSQGHLLYDENGAPCRLQGLNQDITARKLAEEHHAKLEHQLRQAQKMEAIGTLAGGIAHDFNNILYAITGYSELVMDALPENSLAREDLQEVLTAASRATDLVQRILAFSRQTRSDTMPVQVGQLVKEVLRLIRASLPSTIKIETSITTSDVTVLANPTELHQVLMNLCTNAGQAMRLSGGTLEVGLTIESKHSSLNKQDQGEDRNYAVLTVRDTGPGIPLELQERIFDPFFTTKEVGEGTGLGLSTVHGIVAELDGFIQLDSEVGRGTTFSVFLPSIKPEVALSSAIADIPRGSGKIMFIDDEATLARMGKITLERLGYEVVSFTRSTEALKCFLSDPMAIDLVITDQTMPELTGTDMAVRMLNARPEQRIILCTGYSHVISEERHTNSAFRIS